ncbi:hypothetical protein GFV12_02475 [Desulfurobacterium thermolithotrophum]|uniref:porin n=1 Tax=Desulfurobacterium thermolithotrophum TaxID=64160 RepID=UPI0013D53021|nr:porin [Desulfurobacterium thermolithotrophum]
MRKTLALASTLLVLGMGTSSMAKDATVLIGGVPVKQLYVDEEGRLYLTPGEGREPVKIEVPAAKGTPVVSKDKKIKIGGKAYIHWDYDMQNKSEHNTFKITRNYLEVRGYFNDKDYFRTTLDVKQTDTVDKGSYVARLKYAYVYLHDVLPYTGVELGMAHRPWIDWEEHHGWLHRDIEETLIENKSGAGLINSADLGVNFKGKYGIASWEFGVFNGEGYHETENSDHFGKSLEGRLSLNLFKGFTLSGHTVHSFDHKAGNYDRHIYHVHAVYNNPYFLVAGQYIWDKDNRYNSSDIKQKGYSINGDLKLKPFTGYPVGVLARYDHWDTGKGGDDTRKHFVYGVFYKLNKHVKLSLAHDRVIAGTNSESSDSSSLMAVAEVKW